MHDDLEGSTQQGEKEKGRSGPEDAQTEHNQRVEVNSQIEDITDVMFRNVVSTHVDFTFIADNKAYVMIYVNSIIIGGLTTLLLPQLGENRALIIPTILMFCVCLVSLCFSVVSIRPVLGRGLTSREDVRSRRSNLLFFGNFYRMSLQDFEWGMREMLKNEDLVLLSMIRDIYFLGKGLGAKYRQVRISYNIFLFGMLGSVLAFVVTIIATGGNFGSALSIAE